MGLVAAGAGWVMFSRFPEVFFDSDDWRATRKGRVSRAVIIVLFVLFARTFVFQQSKIPSGSMMDTLLVGDYIMLNRFRYASNTFG